ncbi:dihydroxyacetone kinase subunit DhaL [Serratia microhaemolytica]|uniref:dihydroxyacetone kinase subunit DhaL n=1 Tax=Serratia microhaemolytica TaxID=2675110 RepID=UPI000FDDB665|nr:dihydroxyacetone kinase subunit DhaL [Serratia microhaemolytica]
MTLSKQQVVEWLMRCGDVFAQQRDFLTQLDTEIGDGDHGLNMNRGFNKVVEKLPSVADKDIGFILKNAGMTLLSSVGGASGPLFGTFFIRAAQVANAKQSLDLAELKAVLQEGADGVLMRGKAEPGDKTMCDVWGPVVESLTHSLQQQLSVSQALQQAATRAEQAAQATITMQARKGRASYLGERSIGHQDPGATSAMLMMQTLATVVEATG